MQMIDFSQRYEQAAEFFALEYGNGLTHKGEFFGQYLVRGLLPETIADIECDIEAWERRVSDYCYAQANATNPEL